MAQGWSLATGQPGVAVVTGGPGLMNAIAPIADAKLAGIPLVVITSHIRQNEVGTGYPQDMDQMSVVSELAKWAVTVREPEHLPRAVGFAIDHALNRRGPAVLEIPLDVQLSKTDLVEIPEPSIRAVPLVNLPSFGEAGEMISRAERPVAIVGEGQWW